MASTIYAHENENWRDLLTAINGTAVTYDAIGNMLNDGTRRYTWQEGRKLASLYKGNATWSFSYDANGMRTSRSERGTVYNYTYHGSQLTNMTYGVVELHFNYDASGRPMSFTYTDATYDEVTYYYMLNLQGDVVAILDSSGEMVVGYIYDAWGRLIKTTDGSDPVLVSYNPLRYRGYVYDWETGLYYLQSRYYNPEIGRFINADSLVSTGQGMLGYNMFAYCGNNPVNRVDSTGQFWEELLEVFVQTIKQNSGYFAIAGGGSQVDTPAPGPADVAAGILLIGGVLVCAGVATYTTITAPTPSISIPKAEEKAEAIPAPPSLPTVIYRYGGTNPGNLTLKAKDKYSGLSFSTVPMPGAAMTTIEALNATGVVYAVQDGATHVSVRPVGATMEEWINAGSSSIWTQAVKSVVIKWDGGY